jgi:hypothetical protein
MSEQDTAAAPRRRLWVTWWLPAQHGAWFDLGTLAARLRDAGWAEAADTADRIARREITDGDAADDSEFAGTDELSHLARAIRRNEGEFDPELSGAGTPLGFGDIETVHVYVAEPEPPLMAPHAVANPEAAIDALTCGECGAEVWISQAGTAHHWGRGPDDIDHDADAGHVAVPSGTLASP